MNKLLTAALGLAVAVLPVLAASPAFAADEPKTGPDTRACANAKIAEAEALVVVRDAKRDLNRLQAAAKSGVEVEGGLQVGDITVVIDANVKVSTDERAGIDALKGVVSRAEKKLANLVEKREEKCAEPTTTPTPTPTTTPPVDNDVDCDEVSDARAQEILDADRNDPNNLDDDNDGVACEEEEVLVADNDVVVTPSGGVNTGGWRR